MLSKHKRHCTYRWRPKCDLLCLAESDKGIVEVPQREEIEVGEQCGAEWIGASSLHREFGALIASRQNTGEPIPKVDGEDSGSSGGLGRAQESAGLSSLQSLKKLGADQGLLGFQKVEKNGARLGVRGTAESARVSMEATPANPSGDAPGETEAAETLPGTTKGGTKIIRGKGRGEVKRFELYLGQRASAVELPPSEPIPLSAMGFTAPAASTTEARKQGKRGGARGQRGASGSTHNQPKVEETLGPARNKSVEDAVRNPDLPEGQEALSREDFARKVKSFASRLFQAVSASDSHREILPRFLEPTQPKPQTPNPVSELSQAPVLPTATDPLRQSDGILGEALEAGLPTEVKSVVAIADPATGQEAEPVPEAQIEMAVIPSSMAERAETEGLEASAGTLYEVKEGLEPGSNDASAEVELALLGEETVKEQLVASSGQLTEVAPPVDTSAQEPVSSNEPLVEGTEPVRVAPHEPGSAAPTGPPPQTVNEAQPAPLDETFNGPDWEDRILLDTETEEEGGTAEPSFPHWLAGPGSRDALLVDAEVSAARIWEGTGAVKQSETGDRTGEPGGSTPTSGEPDAGSRVATSQNGAPFSGGNGAIAKGARLFVDLRSASGTGSSKAAEVDLGSSTGEDTLPDQQRNGRPKAILRLPTPSSDPHPTPTTESSLALGAELPSSAGSQAGGLGIAGQVRKEKRTSGFVNLVSWSQQEDPLAKPEAAPRLELKYTGWSYAPTSILAPSLFPLALSSKMDVIALPKSLPVQGAFAPRTSCDASVGC